MMMVTHRIAGIISRDPLKNIWLVWSNTSLGKTHVKADGLWSVERASFAMMLWFITGNIKAISQIHICQFPIILGDLRLAGAKKLNYIFH